VSFNSFAFSSLIIKTAAAPSFNFDELAAVTTPFLSNAGRSVGSFSKFTFSGSSSFTTTTSPVLDFTGTPTISSLNLPLF
jgi:hypothetical protein